MLSGGGYPKMRWVSYEAFPWERAVLQYFNSPTVQSELVTSRFTGPFGFYLSYEIPKFGLETRGGSGDGIN